MYSINNQKTSNIGFQSTKTGETSMEKSEEKINFLNRRLHEVLNERVEKEVPENGQFRTLTVSYSIPDTQNDVYAIIEYDKLNPKNSRRMSIGVRRQGSDRITSSYVFKGTKQELLDYINNQDNRTNTIQLTKELSDDVDKYYRELF